MEKIFKKSIFIFRFDLRLDDNIGLINALKLSNEVIPVYLKDNLDAFKVDNKNNKQFLLESLVDLNLYLKKFNSGLILLNNIKDLSKIIKNYKDIEAIFINKQYHPVLIKQEEEIEIFSKKNKLKFNIFHDYLLHEILTVSRSENKNTKVAYKVFTPFFNRAKCLKVLEPIKNNYKNFIKVKNEKIKVLDYLKDINKNINLAAGYLSAQKILNKIDKYKDYKIIRDFPAIDGTTKLSAYINSGAISIRKVYYAVLKELGKNHEILRQLYWREFYYNLYYQNPELFIKGLKRPKFKWFYNKSTFQQWADGKTGIEFVDASMHEINKTGFMHGRCRMIVSNFLTMRLNIDWTMGERYFAQNLIDYDPILNNGNWQYMAQIGADTAGYVRILNPEMQRKKFDSKRVYIKKWL